MENFTMKSFILATLGATIVALATSGVNWFLGYKENKQYQEKMASILYYDLDSSKELISIAISVSPQVPHNSHSMILNDYLEYYSSLYPKLNVASANKLMIYYRNIALLESSRQRYWANENINCENQLSEKQFKDEYRSTLLGMEESLQKLEIDNVISTLKERAGI